MNEIQNTPSLDLAVDPLIKGQIERLAAFNAAMKAISKCRSAAEARPVLEAMGAVFENELDFELSGLKAKLQGPRGEVGRSARRQHRRDVAKAARKARRSNRRG